MQHFSQVQGEKLSLSNKHDSTYQRKTKTPQPVILSYSSDMS